MTDQNFDSLDSTQDILDIQISFFRQHQANLAEKHYGKSVLIHNESIIGIYGSDTKAYTDAIHHNYNPGTFLIRLCLRPEEEVPAMFHSRVL